MDYTAHFILLCLRYYFRHFLPFTSIMGIVGIWYVVLPFCTHTVTYPSRVFFPSSLSPLPLLLLLLLCMLRPNRH